MLSVRDLINTRLAELASDNLGLTEVIRYALLAPGKRLRPLLVMLTASDLGVDDGRALDFACALEMIHAASLILDDLPCMDNAVWRRDRHATHIRFGQDAAVLASVALLSRAQEVVATARLDADIRCQAISIIGRAVGAAGLSGGQYMDLRRLRGSDAADLADVNELKTGSLFVAAVRLGCAAANASEQDTRRMVRFAGHLGQAFQILDDLADADEIAAGRGDDDSRERPTLPSVLGSSDAHASLLEHLAACGALLDPDGQLTRFVGHVFEGSSEARR